MAGYDRVVPVAPIAAPLRRRPACPFGGVCRDRRRHLRQGRAGALGTRPCRKPRRCSDGGLVAAVEIVSPANKDRPEHRRAFVAKCSTLLQQRVSVAIVDLVTTRQFNLYGELLDLIGQTDSSLTPEPPPLYAAACRWTRQNDTWRLETWAHALALGQPLPTLPLWLADDLAVPLELEASYEETCRILRIA